MPGNRGGRNDRGPLPRNVQVSKKISWLLRHGAEREGLKFDSNGYINVQEVLNNRNLRSLKVTFEELRQVVVENDKQRFSMVPVLSPTREAASDVQGDGASDESEHIPSPSANPKDWLIRANQGHSLKIDSEGLLQPITTHYIPDTTVHGTTHANWLLIVASGGLKPMGRNHVHFASGLPAGSRSIIDADTDQDTTDVAAPVISGMRKNSTILIFLDTRRAMDAGLKFWRSDNGVILTEGGEAGLVPIEFFMRVEDRTGHGILVEDGKQVKEAPASWAGKAKAKS